MKTWENDAEMFTLMRETLYSPVIGDVLDGMSHYHCFLPRDVHPLLPAMKLAGRAMPVLMADVHGPQKKPFGSIGAG
jgi:hypothetical protein